LAKKKAAPAPKLGESIQALREAQSNLDKREAHLQTQITQAVTEAKKKHKAKDKRGAMFQLKRKKMFEKQLEQIGGKKLSIEQQVMALEGAASNKDVLVAMKQGAQALQKAVKDTNIEKVDEVMDEINESMALAEELSEAMAQPIGPAFDEEELASEMAELDQELMEDELESVPSVPVKAVKVPDAEPVVKEPAKVSTSASAKVAVAIGGGGGGSSSSAAPKPATKEDQELRALEASLGL